MSTSTSSSSNAIRRTPRERIVPVRLMDLQAADESSRTRRRAPRATNGGPAQARATSGGATSGRTQRANTATPQQRRAALRLLEQQLTEVEGQAFQSRRAVLRKLRQNVRNQNARNAPRPSHNVIGAGNLTATNLARRDTDVVTDKDSLDLFKADNVVEKTVQLFTRYRLSCVMLGRDENNLEVVKLKALTDIATAMHYKAGSFSGGLPSFFKKRLRMSYTHGVDGNGSTARNERVYVVVTPKLTGHGLRHSEDLWYSLYHPALTHENIRSGNVPTFYCNDNN